MTNDTRRPVALVTGASSGIGKGFAERLASTGHDLVLVARSRDALEAMAAELRAAHRVSIEVVDADLATDAGVSAVEERIGRGDIDLLVNNAGFGTSGEFATLPLTRELEEVDLNVRAVVRLSHAALASMLPRSHGGIINVASTGAFQPVPYMSTYGATKAFVLHFSEGLHEEAAPHGVTVTCLCPGPVKTRFQETAGVADERMPGIAWTSVDQVVGDALSSLRRKRAVVVPGFVNRATATSVRVMPRFLTRRIAGRMFRDASKQRES